MGVKKLGALAIGALIIFGIFAVIDAAQIGPIRPGGGGGTTIPSSARVPFLASCPAGWTQDATLDGTMLLATTAGHGDVGQTGGANLVTPTGANSTPSFTGNSVTSSAVSAGTPAGSVTQPTFMGDAVSSTAVSAGTPAGTVGTPVISWPAGVPTSNALTFTGTAFTSVINHTHTITVTDPGHGRLAQGSTTASTSGTHIMTSTATGGSARATADGASTTGITASSANPGGGVSSITPAGTINTPTLSWPAGVPTSSTPSFTGSALSTHQHTTTATGTVSQPTFTGSALGTHSHTTTATGTVSTPLFTGDQFDNRSAYTKVIWCRVSGSEPAPVAHTNWGPAWIVAIALCGVLLYGMKRFDLDRP